MTQDAGAAARQQRREQRSRRALAATVTLARRHGLRVTEPRVLNDLFSLMVHLRPAPVVARVATCMPRLRSPISDWLEREIRVAGFLEGQGVPVAPPSRELPPGPHLEDGFGVTFWTYLEPDRDRVPTAADCSAMLVDLHAVLRGYPGELPPYPPDFTGLLQTLEQPGDVLSPAEVARVRAAADRLRPLWESPEGELQPLHGDAHPGNLLATGGELVWIDLEDVCRGPLEWDLATIMDPEAVAAHHRPDPARLAACTHLRTLQVVLALVAFYDDFRDLDGWDASIHGMIDTLPTAP